MIASAWKISESDKRVYKIQVERFKSKKELKEIFSDWKESGTGWNIKENFRICLFQKEFADEDEWLAWARRFPFYLVEIKERAGVTKVIQLTNRKA
jgi:hypothetical protein